MLLLPALLTCLAPQSPATAQPRPASIDRPAEPEAWFAPELADECNRAAARGLAWLCERQLAGGSWLGYVGHKMMDDYELLEQALSPAAQEQKGEGHLGVTAICGMAFLAGGHLPDRGEHREVIARTHDYVATRALENGLLTAAGTRMYSHAFATLFLAEVYGMSADDRTKQVLERAVNLIVDSQNQFGGWRYNPFDREIDLSVTVCQLQALRAARNIGIRVPAETIQRAMDYVYRSRVPSGAERGQFYYKIYGRGAYSKPSEYAINAAGLTALACAGVHDDDVSDPVLRFLDREYDQLAYSYGTHFYYWYGNYYAAQAFYQYGGTRLRDFYARLARDLLRAQLPDGRWRNRVGPGDEFATAMACILLQMPKQYLPIFQR